MEATFLLWLISKCTEHRRLEKIYFIKNQATTIVLLYVVMHTKCALFKGTKYFRSIEHIRSNGSHFLKDGF